MKTACDRLTKNWQAADILHHELHGPKILLHEFTKQDLPFSVDLRKAELSPDSVKTEK